MSKLNTKPTDSRFEEDVQLAGGFGAKAAKQTPIALLRRMTLACLLWEDMAYVDGASAADEIKKLVPLCDENDVIDLAIECREKQKLRHIPLYLIAVLVKHTRNPRIADALSRICSRADMMGEFLAIYQRVNDGKLKPIANVIKKGLGKSFDKFDEYQLAKYDRDAQIKLRDVLRLCHPTPTSQAQSELWAKVKDRTLATPDTWEVGLSAAKSDGEKKKVWESLITNRKLGALAMLRNLSNMTKVSVPLSTIRAGLTSCKSGMLLPLNFLAAYKANPQFSPEITKMMLASFSMMPKLPGRTLMIIDLSGSMNQPISLKSQFTRRDVAIAMAMLAVNICEDCTLVATAGSDMTRLHSSEHIEYPCSDFGINKQISDVQTRIGGGGIFTRQVLEWCQKNVPGQFDRIIVFSDSQDCDHPDKRVPKPYGKRNYIVDVSAMKHGVNYNGLWSAEISGWSENFIPFIAQLEGIGLIQTDDDQSLQ